MSSPHTTILVVDDEVAFAQVIGDHLRKAGHTILMAADAEGALKHLEKKRPDLVLLDVNLPGISGIELIESMRGDKRLPTTVVMSAYGDLETALKAVRAGAVDFLAKPFRLPALELKVEIALERARFDSKTTQRRASGQRQAEAERPDEQKLESSSDLQMYHGMIGRGAKMTALFKMIDRVAQFTSTVLVHGESGTGKELVAKALHRASPRATGPFIAVNCGAIPENLLESELFGHVRGAFTDATQDRKGLFEQAHRGTLLLDEIVDLPLHLQVKLLRALQEGEVRPIGSNRSIQIDVRVVAASAVTLRERVLQGHFREDLFYRLSVIELHIPALRERLEDISLLVEYIVANANKRLGTSITGVHPHALAKLMSHAWPGNVRELQNVIEQACVMSETAEIDVEALPRQLGLEPDRSGADAAPLSPLSSDSLSIPLAVQATERALIEAALQRTKGNRTRAAKLLEISQRNLLNKIQRYEIDIPGQVGRPPRH